MSRLEAKAECIKLSRLFDVPEERLQKMEKMDAANLRALREAASAVIYDDACPVLARVAAASKLFPISLLALVAEKIFGPMLCARTAGMIAPQRALEVVLKLPNKFLANASSMIDPRSAKDLIAKVPLDRVRVVTALMIERGDYVTMGRFVDYVPREIILKIIGEISDNSVLLYVAFYVENKARLNDIMDQMSESRLREIVQLAGSSHSDIWPEALALMNQLSPQWRGRIGDLTAAEDTLFLTGLLQRTQRADLWDAMLPVIGCMSVESRRKLARIPALADAQVLQGIICAAHINGLWAELLPLIGFMSVDARKTAAKVMEHLPQEILFGLIETVSAKNLWPDFIGIFSDMDKGDSRQVLKRIVEKGDLSMVGLSKEIRLLIEADFHG